MKLEVTMSQSVTIKSNKYGINLVLDPEIGFDELLKDVVEKFKASSTFFKNAKLALSFEGRKLSEEEEQQIISAIESNTSIEILCIVENGTRQEAVMKEQVEAFRKLEKRKIPADTDYNLISGLKKEAREKLIKAKPENIGQAGRISGVSPADIAVLYIYLDQNKRG